MGYPPEIFVDEPDDDSDLLCDICFSIMKDAVKVCENEHLLCEGCVDQVQLRSARCPTCRGDILSPTTIVVDVRAKIFKLPCSLLPRKAPSPKLSYSKAPEDRYDRYDRYDR